VRLERLALLLLLVACKSEPTTVSSKGRVMAKPGAVWGQDVANALGLQNWELCSELGRYDCIADAHLVTLGGVEPTVLGIDDPLPNAAVSAPIAVDRVASSACAERYDRDKAGPTVIFGPVLAADTPAARKEVAGTLVRRVLAREPTKSDLSALGDLYDTVVPLSSDPVRDWSVGACVIVTTSTEALFY